VRTFEELFADAADDGGPFSNMTSFEVWAATMCQHGAGCVHDGTWGGGAEGVDCPLITVALTLKTPKEWTDKTDAEAITAQAYVCTEFEEVVATATDDEPADEDPDAAYAEPRWRPVETVKGQEGMF